LPFSNFKTKQDRLKFKEKAVQRSKDKKSRLNKAYFTTQQTLGTRIRTGLMLSVAEKVKDPEKGIDAWVTQNLNRPMLQVKGEVQKCCARKVANKMLAKSNPRRHFCYLLPQLRLFLRN